MRRGFALIILEIAVVVILIGAFIYASPKFKNSSQPTPSPIISPSPSPRDETANWKTYTNEELQYTFKYPPNWLEPSRMQGDTTFVIGYPIKEEYRNDPFLAKSADKTFWITLGYISQSQLNVMGITYCGANPNDSSRCQLTYIGGVRSTIDWGMQAGSQTKAFVSIPHQRSGIVTFELQPVVPESKELLNQILSTFQFTE